MLTVAEHAFEMYSVKALSPEFYVKEHFDAF
jgi:hypothetical protein